MGDMCNSLDRCSWASSEWLAKHPVSVGQQYLGFKDDDIHCITNHSKHQKLKEKQKEDVDVQDREEGGEEMLDPVPKPPSNKTPKRPNCQNYKVVAPRVPILSGIYAFTSETTPGPINEKQRVPVYQMTDRNTGRRYYLYYMGNVGGYFWDDWNFGQNPNSSDVLMHSFHGTADILKQYNKSRISS